MTRVRWRRALRVDVTARCPRAADDRRAGGRAVSPGNASVSADGRGAVSTSTCAAVPGLAAGRTRYTRSHPACSRTTPTTRPIGMPLGYTPPSPDESTTVPSGIESRYEAPRNSRNGSLTPAAGDAATMPDYPAAVGERADPELRVRPRHGGAGVPARARHDADEPLGRHHRIERRDPRIGPRAEQQHPRVGGLRLVQHLGRHVRRADPPAQAQEAAKPLVLGREGRQRLRQERSRVPLRRNVAEPARGWCDPPPRAPGARRAAPAPCRAASRPARASAGWARTTPRARARGT